jgi:hypothetical protein
MSLPNLNSLIHVRLCLLVLSDTREAQRSRAATKLAVDNVGSAAGCEAMAVPRRYRASSTLGCAPGSGFAAAAQLPQTANLWAEPEPGAQPKLEKRTNGEAQPSPHIRRRSRY